MTAPLADRNVGCSPPIDRDALARDLREVSAPAIDELLRVLFAVCDRVASLEDEVAQLKAQARIVAELAEGGAC